MKRSLQTILTAQLQNMIDNLERFHWTHEFYLEKRAEWMQGAEYRKAPRWLCEYLAGFSAARFALIWRHKVVFSYEHNGRRITIESAAHRRISPRKIDVTTGAYVWREAPEKFFTQPGAATKRATLQV